MKENKIEELPLNDRFAQYYRQMPSFITEEVKQERETRTKMIKECNHLFVLLEDGKYIHNFNSSNCEYVQNTVECVHCGLTNKFMCFEDERWMISGIGSSSSFMTLDSKLFREIFASSYIRAGKSFDESAINLISEKPLNTNHPGLLYKIANLIIQEINPDATLEEIFEIMIELDSLETRDEKIRLRVIEDAEALITRYYNHKRKNVLKKIRCK